MKLLRRLPSAEALREAVGLTGAERAQRETALTELRSVFDGTSDKKILIIGPCSADRADAVLEYADRLRELQDRVAEKLILVPRIYTGKPRTTGQGYKGMLHSVCPTDPTEHLAAGLIASRTLHRDVIRTTGLIAADELLYPDTLPYVEDLLGYFAIGARSVENQQHRLISSAVDLPVGMKNPTGGNLSVMLNAIKAARVSQHVPYNGWEAETEGNPYAHAILRGYVTNAGTYVSNYSRGDLEQLLTDYTAAGLDHPAVIVDCSHANSAKQYKMQLIIADNVLSTMNAAPELMRFVKGLMIESYLEDGSQKAVDGCYGKSITDGCIGWQQTESLVLKLADQL